MNAIAELGGLSTAMQRWTLVALVFVVYSLVLFLGSCQYGKHLEGQARDAGALAEARQQQKADVAELGARSDLDHQITTQADADAAAARDKFLRLRLEIPHVVATFVPSKDAARIALPAASADPDLGKAPLGECVVGRDFVGVWNAALAPAAAGAAELDAGAAVSNRATEGTEP